MVISFLNQKGGVGKTTLAINAAGYYQRAGKDVLLLDTDPQRTSSRWAELREVDEFPVVHIARDNMAKEISALATKYDRVVIDGPPRAESLARAVIIASDIVVVPIEPSGASDWASEVTIQQIQEARNYNAEIKAAFVIARALPRTIISTDIREHVVDVGLPIFDTTIHSRVAYAEALTMGRTIFEWEPVGPATDEMTNLMGEIEEGI